ncbi:MAG: hypothetical protein JW797_16910 [Bradymonadales bacterium]|nr:hypothetical protein [Bradymonadales bacterium]
MMTTADDAIARLIKAVMKATGEEREKLVDKHIGTLRSEHVYQLTQQKIEKLSKDVHNLEIALAEVRRIMAERAAATQHSGSGSQESAGEPQAGAMTEGKEPADTQQKPLGEETGPPGDEP